MQNLEKLTFEANPKEFPLVYSQKTRKQTQGHSKIKQSKTKPTNMRTYKETKHHEQQVAEKNRTEAVKTSEF